MKLHNYIFILFIVLGSACNNSNNTSEKASETTTADSLQMADSIRLTQVFEGVLPCADCDGILTKLSLFIHSNGKTTFKLAQTYQGKGDGNNFTTTGNYNTERGFENDNDAQLIILNWDKPADEQEYYLIYSNDTTVAHKLNDERKLIKSELNYSLKKVSL